MEAPVPKPRSRYKLDKEFRSLSTESSCSYVSLLEDSETNQRIPEAVTAADTGVTNGHDSADNIECPLTPPLTPQPPLTPSDGTSDSSTDEAPATPASPNSDKSFNIEAAKEGNATTCPETTSQINNPQSGGTEPLKSSVHRKPVITRKPRAATIRVSRRKRASGGDENAHSQDNSHHESAVSRSSWLDIWKGRKHNVLWAMFDGQLMSLWKKRTDKFPEYIFHVSSITNVRVQDRGRFSIYFRKKHLDFMAHSEDVQMGWVSSLQASRGREPPASPLHHSPLVMKEQRSKVYGAICGHHLWIYNSKEDFNLGLGTTIVSMNVASVKQIGRHSFSLITPYKTFNFSVDSSRELTLWLNLLSEVIRRALSCSEVALRLWSSPWNKVCADCGSPNPEWASVNLLMVICEACAGLHRSLGSSRCKVRSLKLDSKVWTEPLIELFVYYGNKAANNVWAHNVPAMEQIHPDAPQDQRAAFIQAKYCRGAYRKIHPLSCSQALLNKRLCEVVCGADVEETLSLLCSGARVLSTDGSSPITIAENAGQALQTELLRCNEHVEAPDFNHQRQTKEQTGLEELHGRLDNERFLFSHENESAACDVLELREVISIFDQSTEQSHVFEMLTLTDTLYCTAETRNSLLSHMQHVIRVVMAAPLDDGELDGVMGVSRLFLREGTGLQHAEVWVTIRKGEILIYPQPHSPRGAIALDQHTEYKLNISENVVEVTAAEKTVYLRFEGEQSCSRFHSLISKAIATDRKWNRHSMYRLPVGICGSVPPEVQRCISHISMYGLKVEGLYRCCGSVVKVSQLVEELRVSPGEAVLETGEEAVLEAAGALKHFLRQDENLIPASERPSWAEAAALEDVTERLQVYRRLVKQLPPDNRMTLATLFAHLYSVQTYSQVNRMTAHNLALVFVPTLFHELGFNTHMLQLTKELIVHHSLLFQNKPEVSVVEEEIITVF